MADQWSNSVVSQVRQNITGLTDASLVLSTNHDLNPNQESLYNLGITPKNDSRIVPGVLHRPGYIRHVHALRSDGLQYLGLGLLVELRVWGPGSNVTVLW